MVDLERTTLGAAVALSVLSIGDAILRATTEAVPPWDDEGGTTWGTVTVGVLMAVTFGLLAAVLIRNATWIDRGSAPRRWIRRVLVADMAVLTAGSVMAPVVDSAVIGASAGFTFLLMFVVGAALGVALLRRTDSRIPALLMASSVPVLGMTFALEALATGWGHPGYAETALYLGIALLGLTAAGPGASARDRTVAGALA